MPLVIACMFKISCEIALVRNLAVSPAQVGSNKLVTTVPVKPQKVPLLSFCLYTMLYSHLAPPTSLSLF